MSKTKEVGLTNVDAVKKSVRELREKYQALETQQDILVNSLGDLLQEPLIIDPNSNPNKILLDVRKKVMELSAFAHTLITICDDFLNSRKNWRA